MVPAALHPRVRWWLPVTAARQRCLQGRRKSSRRKDFLSTGKCRDRHEGGPVSVGVSLIRLIRRSLSILPRLLSIRLESLLTRGEAMHYYLAHPTTLSYLPRNGGESRGVPGEFTGSGRSSRRCEGRRDGGQPGSEEDLYDALPSGEPGRRGDRTSIPGIPSSHPAAGSSPRPDAQCLVRYPRCPRARWGVIRGCRSAMRAWRY